MRFPSLSVSCLAWSIASSTTRAFSTTATNPVVNRYGVATATTAAAQTTRRYTSSTLQVASADTIAVADMERGVGGRVEAAFEAAKNKGEAAFVTFITAGYPAAQGAYDYKCRFYSDEVLFSLCLTMYCQS